MDPTIYLALAVPLAFVLGVFAGRRSLADQLEAARMALSRGAHLAEREHTAAARPLLKLVTVRSCVTCKTFDTCNVRPKPYPAPSCHVSLFADIVRKTKP